VNKKLERSKRKKLQNSRILRTTVKVTDDWYPCLPGHRVAASYYIDEKRISFWGDDDFGLEKLDATKEEFHELVNMKGLNKEILRKMGFVYA
jgi:hypothetical protein